MINKKTTSENRRILQIAVPSIISNITVPLLGLIDVTIVGHLGSPAYIGAIAVGGMLFNIIYWIFGSLRMGTSGMTSQAYGQHDLNEINRLLIRSVGVGLFIALCLLILQYPILNAAFTLIQTTEEVKQLATTYFYICIWGAPAMLGLYGFAGWFIGMQNSRFPMYISIVINLLNVAFGVWFVYGLHWGIASVAWSTVVAQYGGLLTASLLWLIYYRRFIRQVSVRESFDLRPMLRFFRVNRDIFLRTACIVIVYTFFTSASSGMGDTILAINALLMQLFTLFSYMMDGFAFAAESLIGRYVGARNPAMVQRSLRGLLAWSGGVALLYVGIYALFWEPLLGLFTSSPAILVGASEYILWVVAVPLVGFAPFLVDGALIGATATRVMRNSVFLSMVAFFAVYFTLRGVVGNNALWLAFMVFLVLRGALQYWMTGGLKRL